LVEHAAIDARVSDDPTLPFGELDLPNALAFEVRGGAARVEARITREDETIGDDWAAACLRTTVALEARCPNDLRFRAWRFAMEVSRSLRRYTLGQWGELGVFLDDARVPLDNCVFRNGPFVGSRSCGRTTSSWATLPRAGASQVSTRWSPPVESRGINPFDYLADVLARVQGHRANAIDALLPAAWASRSDHAP
jgi:hypothetical protein